VEPAPSRPISGELSTMKKSRREDRPPQVSITAGQAAKDPG
jgi:hypothetical protein